MSVQNIGKNTAEEFFETIIYMTAYNEARQQISEFTKDIDNPVLQEAIEGAAHVLVFGMVFKLIQLQEGFIDRVFATANTLIVLLITNPKNKIMNKLRTLKGFKLFSRFNLFGNTMNERVLTAQVVSDMVGNHVRGRSMSNNGSTHRVNSLSMVNDIRSSVYQRESLHMQFGSDMAKRYSETLLFKLFTKSFTPQDELVIKKILGRDTASALSIDEMNQVADFLYTKDSNGNPIGLSEAFVDLINGLGFLHNK